MGRFHFSTAHFLGFVTVIALGMAAVVSNSAVVADAAYSAFLGFLSLALVGAFLSRVETRPFWIGLAVFGWIYWFVEFDASRPAQQGPQLWGQLTVFTGTNTYSSTTDGANGPQLITTDLIDLVERSLLTDRSVGAPVNALWRNGGYYPGTIVQVNGGDYLVQWTDGSPPQWTPANQLRHRSGRSRAAGHALMGFLVATLGGALASLAFGKRKEQPTTP